MKKWFCVLFSICLFVSCNAQKDYKTITTFELKELLKKDKIQLVDVRTQEEFNEGYIAEAQNIDYYSDTFEEDIKKLDTDRPVIVYCKSGGRSAKCAEKMIEAGFVKVYDLDGGISQWQHKGFEVKAKS